MKEIIFVKHKVDHPVLPGMIVECPLSARHYSHYWKENTVNTAHPVPALEELTFFLERDHK